MSVIKSISEAMDLSKKGGIKRGNDSKLISTHNLVKPNVNMSKEERQEAIDKFRTPKDEPKGAILESTKQEKGEQGPELIVETENEKPKNKKSKEKTEEEKTE